MDKSYVYFNGKIVEEEQVSISIRSKVVNYGLGVFEGIRAYWNPDQEQLFGFKMLEHYERFLLSAKAVNIEIKETAEELVEITAELLRKNEFKTTTYIRPLAFKNDLSIGVSLKGNENDTVAIFCQPLDKYIEKDEFRVAVSSWTRIADNMLPPRTKATAGYMNSALANMEAVDNGFDEAILLNRHGNVCEGPGENIFLVKRGALITPPVADDILEGITRQLVMDLAKNELGIPVIERSVARTELYNSEEVFFSGTAMEVAPIVEVDRRMVHNGKPGPIYKELKELFYAITHGEKEEYKDSLTPIYK
ncbi:MAG: branched-chain amino acid transaminase [Tissierellia bacterium]|nr:branched-chain amino acid transaminase [Tissierellia bacterium]